MAAAAKHRAPEQATRPLALMRTIANNLAAELADQASGRVETAADALLAVLTTRLGT